MAIRHHPKIQLILPPIVPQDSAEHGLLAQVLGYDKIVVLSPHFDDAILSLGDFLTDLVKLHPKVEVINIFTTGADVDSAMGARAVTLAGYQTANEYVAARRSEDAAALAMLGNVTVHNLDLVDAPWRSDQDRTPLYSSIFEPIHREDMALLTNLESTLRPLVEKEQTLILAPLARGRHVDHLIVRQAAQSLSCDIIYYMDFPYSERHPDEHEFIEENHLEMLVWHGDYAKKQDLLQRYVTQYACLFSKQPFQLQYERLYKPVTSL